VRFRTAGLAEPRSRPHPDVGDFNAAIRPLHRLYEGIYAVGHPLVSREGQWVVAVLACGPTAL